MESEVTVIECEEGILIGGFVENYDLEMFLKQLSIGSSEGYDSYFGHILEEKINDAMD